MKQLGELSDEALLALVCAGDDDAFAVFYRRHLHAVIGYFMRRVGDPELSFDLAAEVFAAVVTAVDRFQSDGPPPTVWLFGIARNKLIDSWRRGRVESTARRRLALEPIVVSEDDLAAIDALIDVEEHEAVALLDELPEEQRFVVNARVLEERSYAEIAAGLKCSEAVVRQRVSRGLSRLRSRLEAER